MKILVDGRFYGLEHAGIGRYSMNLIDELAKLDNKNQYVILLNEKYYKLLNFPTNFKKVRADFRHYTITEQLHLPFIINRHKPDICHFLHFNVPVFYLGKFIVTLHDMEMHNSKGKETTTRDFFSYNLWRIGYKFIFLNAALRAGKIIVPTDTVQKEISSYFKLNPEKFVVTYEGVDESFYKKVNTKTTNKILAKFNLLGKKYFFYNGNAYPHKNLSRAIDAIKQFNNSHDKTYFVIASSRSVFTQRLIDLIKTKNMIDLVKVVGFITDEELKVLEQNSTAFVYPSLMEGFGIQGLEALASGTLLVASNLAVFREIYNGHAIYFKPKSPHSIRIGLTSAYNLNLSERLFRITNGIKYAKRFSWTKMAKKTLALYIKYEENRT